MMEVITRIGPLVCPCGLPLQLFMIKSNGKDRPKAEWCVGHAEKACSPIVHGRSPREVFGCVLLAFMKFGHWPKAKEWIALYPEGYEYSLKDAKELVDFLDEKAK
jgi:hypothetical protein